MTEEEFKFEMAKLHEEWEELQDEINDLRFEQRMIENREDELETKFYGE
jgi:cell division protein FtsB